MQNVIFDLGGVIINLDTTKTIRAFYDLSTSFHTYEEVENFVKTSTLFTDYETGQINDDTFRTELKSFLGKTVENKVIDEAWNAMLLDIPQERIALLELVAQNYNIYLLSNTNAIHVTGVEEELVTKTGIKKLNPLFKQIYYSHEIKLRKPNIEIYEYVLNDLSIKPEDTIFIDDNKDNINGALKLGINALHLDVNKNTVLDFFQEGKIKSDYLSS